MRILGIDHGEKRIGLALSDPLGITAQGLPTLKRSDKESDFRSIGELIAEHGAGEIVVGLPKNMDDSLGEEAKKAMAFAEELENRFCLPVHMVDERLTTVRAERTMRDANVPRDKRREKTDMVAAQLILQNYLDQRTSERRGQDEDSG